MKKIYFLFTFALLAFVAGAQKTVTFDFTQKANIEAWGFTAPTSGGTNFNTADKPGQIVQDGVTLTCTDGKNNEVRFWVSSGKYDFRIYDGSVLTLKANSTIKTVKNGNAPFGTISGNTFTYEHTGKTLKIKSITLTLEGGGSAETVAVPEFSLKEGKYETSQTLTITCASDAKINYQVNEEAEVKAQTSPVTLQLPVVEGKLTTYTVKATAVKGSASSSTVSKVYTIGSIAARTFSLVKDAKNLAAGDKIVILDESDSFVMGDLGPNSKCRASLTLPQGAVEYEVFTDSEMQSSVLILEGDANGFKLKDENGGSYIFYHSGNDMLTSSDARIPAKNEDSWTITIDGTTNNAIIANVASPSREIQYNSSSPRFSCYTGTQDGVRIYKESDGKKVASAPVFSLPAGRYLKAINLSLSTELQGATILYAVCATADEVPAKWNTFVNPIALAEGNTYYVKAKVQKEGFSESSVITNVYVVKAMQDNEPVMAQILISEVAEAGKWQNSELYKEFTFTDGRLGDIQFAVTGNYSGKYSSSYQSWSCEAPGEMTITLPEGFSFHHMEFFANLNKMTDAQIGISSGEILEHAAKNDPYVWNPSNVTNTVTISPEAGKLFFEGFNIYIATSTSGVEEVAAETNVFGVAGGVKVAANAETEVAVYTLAGQLVGQYNVAAGETTIRLEKGFYIVRANEKAAKVIVK